MSPICLHPSSFILPMYPLDDTIAAIASPPGGAARGIVRISGPGAVDCLMLHFRPQNDHAESAPAECLPRPLALVGLLQLPDLHAPLPCDVYVWPGGRSYTGQAVVEIHTLGSPPLLQMVLRAICAAGARPAGPGEFTLRAFLASRIDLTQAEAVLGVIDAGDAKELHASLDQLAGGLARPLHRLRDALLNLLAEVEAGLDFADEQLEFITREELCQRLAEAETDAAAIARRTAARGDATDAVRAVLVGRPNVGKSSLYNALAGEHAALVSEHPGTTRDYLVAEIDFDGVKCRLIDTAGANAVERGEWRGERGEGRGECLAAASTRRTQMNSATTVENDADASAQKAAFRQRREAHFELLCIDSTRPLDDWERAQLTDSPRDGQIVVLTKCDVPRQSDCQQPAIETSAQTGFGIELLRRELRRQAFMLRGGGDVVATTAVRCADALRLACQGLGEARRAAAACRNELAAAEIRAALEELGKVAGAVYTEDVLDRVFSRFCIGK